MAQHRIISKMDENGIIWYYPQTKSWGIWWYYHESNYHQNHVSFLDIEDAYSSLDKLNKSTKYKTKVHPYPKEEK